MATKKINGMARNLTVSKRRRLRPLQAARPVAGPVPSALRGRFCSMPQQAERVIAPGTDPGRARLIQLFGSKWVNGTTLEYAFLPGGKTTEHNTVRKAFKTWSDVGIGLRFAEAQSGPAEHIRIGFDRSDGSWSYVGREILHHQKNMNFGWDISNDPDTALHEIGHALGFPHEHQNPNAGIVWNEEAVYAALAAPPNNWPRETTYWNIIRKISGTEVRGSNWDPNSVMHYPFDAGLIVEPAQFRNGLQPGGGLSQLDRTFVKQFYPTIAASDYRTLEPFASVRLNLTPGQQLNFYITPASTRNYTMQTLGDSDTVLVLFEDVPGGDPRYLSADDDGGLETNAKIKFKLLKDRRYILRVRLYWVERTGETALILS